MRFITEFEMEIVSIQDVDIVSNRIHVRKMRGEVKLGQLIAEEFGWNG